MNSAVKSTATDNEVLGRRVHARPGATGPQGVVSEQRPHRGKHEDDFSAGWEITRRRVAARGHSTGGRRSLPVVPALPPLGAASMASRKRATASGR